MANKVIVVAWERESQRVIIKFSLTICLILRLRLLLWVEMVCRTIVRSNIQPEFPYFYLFIFFFCQKALLHLVRIGKIKLLKWKRNSSNLWLVNSSDVNRLFSCIVESPKGVARDETLKAFIFSLKNNEALPPFKCFAKNNGLTIHKSSNRGPSFGPRRRPALYIKKDPKDSRARIDDMCSVPKEVENSEDVLAGTDQAFSPYNYEVFYLA